jgi:hypothetical protein
MRELIMQLMAAGAPLGAPQGVPQEEYEAIMAKVRTGKPRTDAETQRLQQYNMERQMRPQPGGMPRAPQPAKPSAPVPTHQKEGGIPRAVYNPYSLITDAMKHGQ